MEERVHSSVADDDSITKPIQQFRKATSPDARVKVLHEIQNSMEGLSSQEKEQLIYCLLRESPSFVEGNPEEEAVFKCLMVAGKKGSISAAVRILQDISIGSLDSLAALELSLTLLRNVLCARPKESNDVHEWCTMFSEGNVQETVERWVSLFFRLPNLVANACKRMNVPFPMWTVQGKYFPRIIDCAASLCILASDSLQVSIRDKSWPQSSQRYLLSLIKNMLRRGGEEVTKGLYQVYERQGSEFCEIVATIMRELSPREFAVLSRSMILHIISVGPTQNLSGHCSRLSRPWLDETVRKIVSSSTLHADACVDYMIFSANYDTDRGLDVAYVLASMLANIEIGSRDAISVDSVDSDEDEDDLTPPQSPQDTLLRRHLVAVLDRWSRPGYVLETSNRRQAIVTAFIRMGMGLLCQPREDAASELVAATLEGVTCRLSSTDPEIRRDGMQVAVLLANRLGETLEFDELKNSTSSEAAANILQEEEQMPISDSEEVAKKSSRRRFRITDPDAPYISDDDCTLPDEGSDDSSWGDEDEEAPFDLADDEEDLADTAKPRFLSDCLDLLRTPETDENASSRHETGLAELSQLVRSRPMDLSDIAATITFELVHMENKFDIKGFADTVSFALRSLAVEEPLLVGETLIQEVFQDVGLSDRLSALRALSEAAYEMAGLLDLEKQELSTKQILSSNTNIATIQKDTPELRKIGLREVNARRWGHGTRRASDALIRNSFAHVAPIWFYSLVRVFLERKEDNRLWKGTIGATFLSTIFQTLAAFVECSRYGPGSSVLAKDLIQLVWGFNQADVGDVRTSVLLAVSVSFSHLGTDDALNLLLDGPANMPEVLANMASKDPDEKCRELALGLVSNMAQTIDSMSIRPLTQNKNKL